MLNLFYFGLFNFLLLRCQQVGGVSRDCGCGCLFVWWIKTKRIWVLSHAGLYVGKVLGWKRTKEVCCSLLRSIDGCREMSC